jgi:hypothetical protein
MPLEDGKPVSSMFQGGMIGQATESDFSKIGIERAASPFNMVRFNGY